MVRKKSTTPLARILKERGISTKDLAAAIDISVRTIHNISCGSSSSRLARRRIQTCLGVQLWDDIPLTDQRLFTFEPKTWFEFSHKTTARQWARRFNRLSPGVAIVHGREVHYRRPITVTLELLDPAPSPNLVTRTGNSIRFNQTCRIAIELPPKFIPPGREIEFPSVKDARDAVSAVTPRIANRRGRTVTFKKPVVFLDEASQQSAANRKISASSTE